MVVRCNARNAAGSPCSATPVRPSGWCYWHDPALSAERDAARRKGGAARSNQARAKKRLPDAVLTPLELQGVLGRVLQDVIAGEIEPGVANAAANVSRALVAVREATELEERVVELERRAGTRREWGA